MKLSAQEEYGLRCLIQIGRNQDLNGNSLTIPEISQVEGLSTAHVGKLLRILRMGGFIESERGQSGGYRLGRPAEEIAVSDVLATLGGRLFGSEFCDEHAGQEELCAHSVNCSIRSLWNSVQFIVDKMLSRVSLREMLGDEGELSNCMQHMAMELVQISESKQ